MTKQQKFYRSDAWEKLVRALRIERAVNGVVYCEECGQPILRPYDCIAHHVTELTEENVDDVSIALNPANIKLVHFKCHNVIHKRFGYKPCKHVYLVYGAPCSGKSTFVADNAQPGDLIYDIDRLWAAIRSEKLDSNAKPSELKANVFAMRDLILDNIKTRFGRWNSAYIIGGYPLVGERERLVDSMGVDKVIFIDTPKELCLQRALLKSPEWSNYVETWFERYSPDLPPTG